MRKLIIPLLCLGLFSTLCSSAQDSKTAAVATQDGPRFQFKDGDTYDFGNSVALGPDVFHEFVFTNTGNQPLVIMDAQPACSCTTPEWPKEAIQPGKTGIIKVGFHAKKAGPFFKEVFIQSNAILKDGEKRYTIYIKGEVKE